MHAEKLPEFEHFAPWWNTGGCVSELERAADMRRSCQRGLEDAESELLGARFGQSHGEIYDAVRGHAKRLGDALNSGAEAQKMLAAKIERYAARLDRQKRTFEGMRQQAAKVHAEHQNSVEAYNRAKCGTPHLMMKPPALHRWRSKRRALSSIPLFEIGTAQSVKCEENGANL